MASPRSRSQSGGPQDRARTGALRTLDGHPDRYDRWARTYDDSAMQCMMHQPVHEMVLGRLRRLGLEPRRILDAGCGTGQLLARAGALYPAARLVGVDPSAPMLEQCRARTPSTALIQARAEQLPHRDESFDLVVCTMSLLRWADPAAGVCELARVCAPGATVLIADVFAQAHCRRRLIRHRLDPDLRALFARAGLELRAHYHQPLVLCGVTILLARRPEPRVRQMPLRAERRA